MNQKLNDRTLKLIKRGGSIFLKRQDGWYLGQWTNLAAGYDHASWSKKNGALEFSNLELAFAVAPLYKCKVVTCAPVCNNIRSDAFINSRAE